MLNTILSLAAVIGVIALCRCGLQRLGVTGASMRGRQMALLESISLGDKQRVHLLQIPGETLLVGSSESGVRVLRRIPKCAEAEMKPSGDPAQEDEKVPSRSPPWLRLLGPLLIMGFIFIWSAPASAAPQPQTALAAGAPAHLTIGVEGLLGPERLSSTLEIVALLTVISIAPSLLLMGTCFTRVLVVLVLLRQAMGTASLPPNQILVGLALFVTLFVMAPVGQQIYQQGIQPYVEEKIGGQEAIERGSAPAKDFLLAHTREKDLLLFLEMADLDVPEDVEDVGFATLLPSYMISEIRTAFEIGFMIYLPFLVIDLVIATMLISLGMIMLPPVMISLPFKLMLFVLMDGWNLILTALVSGLR